MPGGSQYYYCWNQVKQIPEIAQAMLRRQQTTATVAARHKIVEGAVGMVESAFVLRIDSETLKKNEKMAADEFRSVNGQIEWMLNKCLKEAGRMKPREGDEKR
jgi:hypothetical protein